MKLVQTNLNAKIIITSIVAAMMIVDLSGCGKSEATKAAEQAAAQQAAERHDARQKFKDKIAAIIVCTKGSTYSEFRNAEMDLRTNFEANQGYLGDLGNQFSGLDAVLRATDHFWSYNVQYPDLPLVPTPNELQLIRIINPDTHISGKLNFSVDQTLADPDFYAKNYVSKGLKKIDDQAEVILNLLTN